jgi:hypothetical protein
VSRYRSSYDLLPAEPFVDWLDERLREEGVGIDELAIRLRHCPRQLRRVRTQRRVSLSIVDSCFVAADDPGALSLPYPTQDR